MKWLISLFLICVSYVAFAQLPTEVKHVELVSEVADTMVLINKPDLDKINTAFYRLDKSDSLNVVNDRIITNLEVESRKLNQIIETQKYIISNKDEQIRTIKLQNKEIVSDLEKQISRANAGKTFWQFTTGAGVIGIIILAIL